MHHLDEHAFHRNPAHFSPDIEQTQAASAVSHGVQTHTTICVGGSIETGHVLTASMPLWQKVQKARESQAQNSGVPMVLRDEAPDGFPGQASASPEELQALLDSSFQLGLQNEMAPVQILQALRVRSEAKMISVGTLRRLVAELLKHLRCYGYVFLCTFRAC